MVTLQILRSDAGRAYDSFEADIAHVATCYLDDHCDERRGAAVADDNERCVWIAKCEVERHAVASHVGGELLDEPLASCAVDFGPRLDRGRHCRSRLRCRLDSRLRYRDAGHGGIRSCGRRIVSSRHDHNEHGSDRAHDTEHEHDRSVRTHHPTVSPRLPHSKTLGRRLAEITTTTCRNLRRCVAQGAS